MYFQDETSGRLRDCQGTGSRTEELSEKSEAQRLHDQNVMMGNEKTETLKGCKMNTSKTQNYAGPSTAEASKVWV